MKSIKLLLDFIKYHTFKKSENDFFLSLKTDDREELCSQADKNNLGNLIYFFNKNDIPEPWKSKFSASFRAASAMELRRSHELKSVLKLFRDSHIKAAPLKGACIAYKAYPHPALRLMCDSDILISENEVDTAWNLMVENGFTPTEEIGHHFHKPMLKSKLGNAYELHYHITKRKKNTDRFSADVLWDNCREGDILGQEVTFLAPEVTLLHCIEHGFRDNLAGGMKVLSDCSFIISGMKPDPEKLISKAEEMNVLKELTIFMNIIPGYFPEEYQIPASEKFDDITKKCAWLLINSSDTQSLGATNTAFEREYKNVSFIGKIRFFKREIFKSPKLIAYRYKCRRNFPAIIPYYFKYWAEDSSKFFRSSKVSKSNKQLNETGTNQKALREYLDFI